MTGAAARSELRNTHVPLFQTLRPAWGFELSGGAGFPTGDTAMDRVRSFTPAGLSLRMEWQPPWIQAAGIFSLGAALDYSFGVIGGGVGGVARYQARYFRNQPIVPFGGYTALYYLVPASTSGVAAAFQSLQGTLIHGPFAGLNILLNIFDSDAAASFFVDYGVLRTYLVLEGRFFQGMNLNAGSATLYSGLRLEF